MQEASQTPPTPGTGRLLGSSSLWPLPTAFPFSPPLTGTCLVFVHR